MEFKDLTVTREFLETHQDYIFVFGDNTIRKGTSGAAAFRDLPNTYGFITKRFPDNQIHSFFDAKEYRPVFLKELAKLEQKIKENPDKIFLISAIGAGLANRNKIWENIIHPGIVKLPDKYQNVYLLF